MDNAAASCFLQPRPFVIALSAATASLGDLGPSAFQLLYALVADEVGILHAVPFPPSSSRTMSTPSLRTFSDILCISHAIPFTLDRERADEHSLRLPDTRIQTVDHALRVILDAVLRSPDGLTHAIELMNPQLDPARNGVYDPEGVISCFLRKVCMCFASLTFEALSRLLHDLRLFVHPNPSSIISSYTSRVSVPDSVVSQKAALDLGQGIPVESSNDFQACANLYIKSREEVAATNLSIESLAHLGRDRSARMALPGAEYVVHLEAQRRRDFSTSIDALHRSFDLSLSEIGSASLRKNRNEKDDQGPNTNDPERHEFDGHQYAALSLGVMYANFGNSAEAGVALDDAIRAAQHCGDEACQARALNWIARTSSSIAKRHQLLHHANDNLALAREELCTVFTPVSDTVPDSVSLHSVEQRRKRGDEKWEPRSASVASARVSQIQERIDYTNPDVRVDSLLMSAATWESHAASTTALSVAKMALKYAEQKHGERLSAHKARALAAVASLMAVEGFSKKGIALLEKFRLRHTEGKKSVNFIEPTNAPEVEILSRCLVWLQFERFVRMGDTQAARKQCDSLKASAECGRHNAIAFEKEDLILDAIEAQCRLHLASHACKDAALEADKLCRRAAGFGRPARVVEGLRLRAEAHLNSDSFSSALQPSLAAVSLSSGLGLESAHVRSVLTLTETMLRMEDHDPSTAGAHAFKALEPVLSKALGGMGCSVRARAYRLYTECQLAMVAGSDSAVTPGDDIIHLIRRAIEAYEQCEDAVGVRDCQYLLGRIHHWRGELDERNEAARSYKRQLQVLSKRQPCLYVRSE